MQVNIAQQIYDLVDQRILRLDRNLKSFDTELIRERQHLQLPVSLYSQPAGSEPGVSSGTSCHDVCSPQSCFLLSGCFNSL